MLLTPWILALAELVLFFICRRDREGVTLLFVPLAASPQYKCTIVCSCYAQTRQFSNNSSSSSNNNNNNQSGVQNRSGFLESEKIHLSQAKHPKNNSSSDKDNDNSNSDQSSARNGSGIPEEEKAYLRHTRHPSNSSSNDNENNNNNDNINHSRGINSSGFLEDEKNDLSHDPHDQDKRNGGSNSSSNESHGPYMLPQPLKSNLKKGTTVDEHQMRNGRKVSWPDAHGKDLAHVHEFESSVMEDGELEGVRNSCVCVIQ